jgi:hypothetical protein
MGRSYWFECVRCGYRAKVSGGSDRGLNVFVQTVMCRDCKELFDAVTKLRLPDDPRDALQRHGAGLQRLKPFARPRAPKRAPSFQAALNRLTYVGLTQLRWVQFPLQCPVSTVHRIQSWTEPDKCPRCGLYLEKNALPYRIWD